MRVTNKMLSNSFLNDMKTNLNNLKTLQQQMTSGKEIRRPSDDPFKAARAMQLHTDINTNKQYKENISDTLNWLDTTDTALDQTGNVLQRVRELLINAGNAAYGPDERKAIKDEINEKMGELTQILNTNFDGKYIFGGSRGTTKPMDTRKTIEVSNSNYQGGAITAVNASTKFLSQGISVQIKNVDENGNVTELEVLSPEGAMVMAPENSVGGKFSLTIGSEKVDINIGKSTNNKAGDIVSLNPGDNTQLIYNKKNGGVLDSSDQELNMIKQKLSVEISQGVTMEYNVTAADVLEFKSEDGSIIKLTDVLKNISTHLDGKIENASGELEENAGTAIKALTEGDLKSITDAIGNLLRIRSEVGAKQNRMESALNKNIDENFNMTEILANTEDIDITEKTMEYATMQTVYMASLQTSARVLQPTLMDYLR